MRQIYSDSMVIHLWANKSVEFARTHDNVLQCRGARLLAGHTELARHAEVAGRPVVFLNRNDVVYKYTVRSALKSDLPVFEVAVPSEELNWHFPRLETVMFESILQASRVERAAKNRDALLNNARKAAEQYNTLAEFAGISQRISIPSDWEEAVEDAREAERRWQAAIEEQRRVEQAQWAEKNKERIERWLAGEDEATFQSPTILLRVKGNRIETSRGAEVPVSAAKRVWPYVVRVRSGEIGFVAALDFRLGHFMLERINPDGSIVVGCHHIEYAELERIAKQLGLPMEANDAVA